MILQGKVTETSIKLVKGKQTKLARIEFDNMPNTNCYLDVVNSEGFEFGDLVLVTCDHKDK